MRGTEAAWSVYKGLKFITFPHYILFASLITTITLRCCHKPLKAAQAKKKKKKSSLFVHVRSSLPTVLLAAVASFVCSGMSRTAGFQAQDKTLPAS